MKIDVELLVNAGRRRGVLSLTTGKQNMILQKAAQAQARYQAKHQTQGHQNWSTSRFEQLRKQLPECKPPCEVCAESWPWNNMHEAADEMYRSWKQSPGHWAAVNGRCDYWGYAMVLGSNGIWYATGIFASLR